MSKTSKFVLIGKWVLDDNNKKVYVFLDNGVYYIYYNEERTEQGVYSVADNVLKLIRHGDHKEKIYTFHVNENKLTLSNITGSILLIKN